MRTLEEKDCYPWEELKNSNVDIYRAFLKLCMVKDPIWEKITREIKEPFRNTHVDEFVEDIAKVFLQDQNEE
ncbi:hypothetical protein Tco_1243818 [Tanacetum coccineum]